MLPEFPNFKPIELSDKDDVEKITYQYPPYSDFNFVSMWSWDIKGQMRLSVLNGNLVVRFTDYVTGEPFYSFLGYNKANETVEKLLNLSIEEEIKSKLNLVTEEALSFLDRGKFHIEEDLDNFDYIYDIRAVSEYKGKQFSSHRNKLSFFLKSFPDVFIKKIELASRDIQKEILKLDEEWAVKKVAKDANFKIKNELLATQRFFQLNMSDNFLGFGIFEKDRLIGYSIFNILSNSYAISHFSKADTNFKGIYEYLIKESSKILLNEGCVLLNYEQDLGLPGLRESKKSFMFKFLRKFNLSFAH